MFTTPKTVAGVIAGFQKTVDELRAIGNKQATEAMRKEDASASFHSESLAHSAESKKADQIADKIEALISGPDETS